MSGDTTEYLARKPAVREHPADKGADRPAGQPISRRGRPLLAILGTRGIPASHSGFETFAEHLAIYLAGRGWDVEVYCQDETGRGGPAEWQGVRLRHVPVWRGGSFGSILFDWAAMRQASREPGRVLLVLGYNTALFGLLAWLRGATQLVNMDGLEWRRSKWSMPVRGWFWVNERLACWSAQHLIADHPDIATHLATRVSRRKITMIPYGADSVEEADPAVLATFGLQPGGYALVVARPEPENSLLEITRAFCRTHRNMRLVVLGRYDPTRRYHRAVRAAADDQVIFPGGIYVPEVLRVLRRHCRLYVHGHQVGGTNPSLVEALGAGSPVLAHDNCFNRWVAGTAATYFRDEAGCADGFDQAEGLSPEQLALRRQASRDRHAEAFTWPVVLAQYQFAAGALVERGAGAPTRRHGAAVGRKRAAISAYAARSVGTARHCRIG